MASPTAAPSEYTEETSGDVTYSRTEKDLPPVAIVDRSPITTRHKLIFGAVAVLGAIAWAIIAFFRGETVNAVWFVIAAICTYGERRAHVSLKGDAPRQFVKQNIGGVIAPGAPIDYFGHYDMNFTTAQRRARFLQKVTRALGTW